MYTIESAYPVDTVDVYDESESRNKHINIISTFLYIMCLKVLLLLSY